MKTTPKTSKPKTDTVTPVMRQYLTLKDQFPGDVLFFRLGDFYEMFFDDAKRAAPIMEVALTARQGTPMCGVPHHSATVYISRLLKAGVSVAVAEQLEDPKKTKGMVKRGVTRVITPGTVVEDELLQTKKNNFLVAVSASPLNRHGRGRWGLAAADVSTGRQWVGEIDDDLNWNQLRAHLAGLNPSETLLIEESAQSALSDLSLPGVVRVELGLRQEKTLQQKAQAGLASYLESRNAAAGLNEAEPLPTENAGVMFLDEAAIRHLELVASSDPAGGGPTLFSVLDRTVSPAGGRMLQWRLLHPSTDLNEIERRLGQVQCFLDDPAAREEAGALLKNVTDIERIMVRCRAAKASPRDLASLRQTLSALPGIQTLLDNLETNQTSTSFRRLKAELDLNPSLADNLKNKLADDPPYKPSEGGVIRDGVDPDLEELRSLRKSGRQWIASMEAEEKEKTGITTLKVGYNDVFGYYLEVSKSHLSKVPGEWIRKQTLANAERYITPSLKEQEEKILGAQEKIEALESRLFRELVEETAGESPGVFRAAAALAELDVAVSSARVAVERGFTRPFLEEGSVLKVEGGRHPVVEKQISRDKFVPNDCALGGSERPISIITGPNMAGKSTYLRQNALIVILAQMGSFVPAKKAEVGVVDRVFTRIGASDRLAQGQSTFMVEMSEVATLLHNCTPKSLLVLDEVGRGTSTYDGVSIAWAVIDFLSGVSEEGKKANPLFNGPRTLFATHYFELTQLAEKLSTVKNQHATAKEWPGPDGRKKVVFLYQIMPGPADRSYGIHVAEMAGVPRACVDRAAEILHQLERGSNQIQEPGEKPKRSSQLDLFSSEHPVVDDLRKLSVETMTPLEALNALAELKKKVRGT